MSTQHALAFSSPVNEHRCGAYLCARHTGGCQHPAPVPQHLCSGGTGRALPGPQLAGWPLSHACQSSVADIAGRDSDG